MSIKKSILSLGLPVELTNKDNSISAVIELNKNNSVVCTYYKLNGEEYPKGNSVYLNDVSDEFLKNCYHKSIPEKK